jgi:hypothetical protein
MSYTLILDSNARANPAGSVYDAEYNFDWSVFDEGKYKLTWHIAPSIIYLTPFQLLLRNTPVWARYGAEAWVAATNTLPNLGGVANRDATTSGVALNSTPAANGAIAGIPYLAGAATASIIFPVGSYPATYTVCSVSRQSGPNNHAVIQGLTASYLHGWWEEYRGIVFQGNWKTSTTGVGTYANWLNMCHSRNSLFVDNVKRNDVVNSFATGNGGALTINGAGAPHAPGGFEFSQLLVWDFALSDAQLAVVGSALNNYLATGLLQ